jgi:hypothetical protein
MLELLDGIETCGGVEIKRVHWEQPEGHFIELNEKHNALTFKFQNGPRKEAGISGCQVDSLIRMAFLLLKKLDEQFPCKENKECIGYLSGAIGSLNQRTMDRSRRGVEGTNQA